MVFVGYYCLHLYILMEILYHPRTYIVDIFRTHQLHTYTVPRCSYARDIVVMMDCMAVFKSTMADRLDTNCLLGIDGHENTMDS